MEGVRATLLEKDPGSARFTPASLEGVGETEIEDYFAPLSPSEYELFGESDLVTSSAKL